MKIVELLSRDTDSTAFFDSLLVTTRIQAQKLFDDWQEKLKEDPLTPSPSTVISQEIDKILNDLI